jgi:asparagine synthase (glutamine-hydrolysing)
MASLADNPGLMASLETDLALAYYRARDDKLILIRDGCGLSPLFYAPKDDGWAVAFDLGDLFELLGGPPPMDEQTIFDFVATHYRYVFRDPGRTFHKGVRQPPAGHSLILSNDKPEVGRPEERRWLDLSFLEAVPSMAPMEASKKYVSLLEENTIMRLEALREEKYAFTVSSGMDSASVAALAHKHLGSPLECWFIAYKDQADSPYDETKGVNDLIQATGWKLNRVDLTAPDLLGETEALMRLTKAPMVTVTWLAHFVLARKAWESGNKYLFSGLGGDESLAGEFEHFFVYFADLKSSGQIELLDKETEAWERLHDHPVFKKSPQARDDWLSRNIDFPNKKILVDQRRYLAVKEYFDQDWWASMESKEPPVPMPHPYPYYLSNRLFQEMSYETSTPTLWSEALSSKAAGVKGIFPMTSPRLLRLALSAPGTLKYQDGVTKMLLRRALSGILPDSSRLNPVKTGFNAPLDQWLKEPKLQKDIHDLLSSPPFSNLGWLAPGSLDRVLEEHKAGTRNHMMLMWPLISVAIFLRQL